MTGRPLLYLSLVSLSMVCSEERLNLLLCDRKIRLLFERRIFAGFSLLSRAAKCLSLVKCGETARDEQFELSEFEAA